MSTSVLFVILFIVVALVVIFWATRTRGNTTGPHVDTTVTAVGAVTEAVEELADTVKHAVRGEPEVKSGGSIDRSGAPAAAPVATLKSAKLKPVVSKAAAPKSLASKSAAPKAAAPKAAAPKAAAPKAAATKAAAPKTATPKAAVSKAAAPKAASKAAAPKAASKSAASKPTAPAASSAPDDLRQLKGVGPKLVTVLNGLGVTRFDQIARWSAGDIATIDAQLGTFTGRIARDNWVEQAGFLAKGDIAGFEAKFGKLDSPGNS
jgi:predicted flap endonuclease-1-like 5' DNA nuclease